MSLEYAELKGGVTVRAPSYFDVGDTVECGQFFRYEKLAAGDYLIIASNALLRVGQQGDRLFLSPCTIEAFETVWRHFFDLERDYEQITEVLSAGDALIAEAIRFAPGIRILNQQFYECMIAFIISQNKQIPAIKQVIHTIAKSYGSVIGAYHGVDYYGFPAQDVILKAGKDAMRLCKAGFRDKYIIDACAHLVDGSIVSESFAHKDTDAIRQELLQVNGIGRKVADCILLFGCGRHEVFPTDVWVKRVIETLYFGGRDVKLPEILSFAEEQFGQYAGFAQQYLFHYARKLHIGKAGRKV